jgi:hypothetical protein
MIPARENIKVVHHSTSSHGPHAEYFRQAMSSEFKNNNMYHPTAASHGLIEPHTEYFWQDVNSGRTHAEHFWQAMSSEITSLENGNNWKVIDLSLTSDGALSRDIRPVPGTSSQQVKQPIPNGASIVTLAVLGKAYGG